MKHLLFLAIALLILAMPISAGGQRHRQTIVEGKITVISVIFPSYDFVRAIAGNRVNNILLTAPGAESHTFEPSPRDIINIRNSDLFIYTGGESAVWMSRILEAAEISSGRVRVMEMLSLVDPLVGSPCLADHHHHDHHHHTHHTHHDHGHHTHHHHGHHHTHHHHHHHDDCDDYCVIAHDQLEFDPHVWTSPRNVRLIVAAIAETLSELDSANAYFFRQNAAAFIAQLDEIDAAFQAVVDGARRRTIVVADRFPFRYFVHHYGLEYFAAFDDCAAHAEPDAATIAFLINTIRSENIPVVFHIELGNERLANIIAEETGARALLLHSAHNLSVRDFNNGVTFLDVKRNNVEALRAALW